MLGYPIFKVIGMSSVVRVISTPQNVNPETHSLLLLALRTLYQRSLDRPEPFDEAQGERNSDIVDRTYYLTTCSKIEGTVIGLIGNYKLPQTFTFSCLMTIMGRWSIAIERYCRYFLRRRLTALRCF
jgi:hypothetical protein